MSSFFIYKLVEFCSLAHAEILSVLVANKQKPPLLVRASRSYQTIKTSRFVA